MKKSFLGLMGLFGLMLTSVTSCGASTFDNTKLVIGLECNYAPFNWTEVAPNDYTLKVANKTNMWADGYDVQIGKILSEKLELPVEIHQIEWDSLIPELTFGNINAVIAGMTDTEERRLSIDFTDEYYRSELVLITSKSVADLYTGSLSETEFAQLIKNKMIVSQSMTVTDDVIEIFEEKYGAIHNNPVSSFALAAQDVVSGAAFAMTAELPVAKSIISTLDTLGIIHMDQSILGETQSELGVSIGIAKGNTELANMINEALSEISIQERNDLMEAAVIRSANY